MWRGQVNVGRYPWLYIDTFLSQTSRDMIYFWSNHINLCRKVDFWAQTLAKWPRPVCYTQGMRPCADEVDFQVDLRLTWGRPEANVLNVLVNTWNWMRSTWGWLEVDLQVYFVGTRTARFSKNVIYDIGTKIILLNKCVFLFFLTGTSRFWKRFWQLFLDLIISKACTHLYKLLNLSDR